MDLSALEQEAVRWHQTLQHESCYFRTIGPVCEGLLAIGVDRPDLVIESIKLLCSPRFIGSSDVAIVINTISGLTNIVKTIPLAAEHVRNEKSDYLNQLYIRASKISSNDWQRCATNFRSLMTILGTRQPAPKPAQQFFPPNSQFSVYDALRNIVSSTKTDIWINDPYTDSEMISLICNVPLGANIKILTCNKDQRLLPDLITSAKRYKQQYGNIELRLEQTPGTQHDRFFIIDGSVVYQPGTSLNQTGSKATTINRWVDKAQSSSIIAAFNTAWQQADLQSL